MSSGEMNSRLAGAQKLYVDANVVIYFVEGDETHQKMADALFEYAEANGIALITSEIAVGECLYGAHKRERSDSVERFEVIFDEVGIFHLVPVEIDIVKRAAKIGAKHRIKLIDALHVVSAMETGCDVFVTNDRGIKSTQDLKVVQLSEL